LLLSILLIGTAITIALWASNLIFIIIKWL
jgi:hypothetical protein